MSVFYESDKEYFADNSRISNSMLTELKKSAKGFHRQYILGERQQRDSKAMRIGTLVHGLLLEPQALAERIIVAPKINRRTKEGQAAYDAFLTEALGKVIVDPDELATARNMVDEVNTRVDFKPFKERFEDRNANIEKGIQFEWFHIQCKAKPDFVSGSRIFCIDVKTTDDPSPSGFARSVLKYGYHRQAALYSIGCREVYGCKPNFVFVVVGNSEPYDTAVYTLSQELYGQGAHEVAALLHEYKARLASGNWAAEWSSGINVIEKPRWYDAGIYEMEEQTTEVEG